jgi:hypothetical protein
MAGGSLRMPAAVEQRLKMADRLAACIEELRRAAWSSSGGVKAEGVRTTRRIANDDGPREDRKLPTGLKGPKQRVVPTTCVFLSNCARGQAENLIQGRGPRHRNGHPHQDRLPSVFLYQTGFAALAGRIANSPP